MDTSPRIHHRSQAPLSEIEAFDIRRGRKHWSDFWLALLVALTFTGYPAISFLSLPLNIQGEQSRLLTVPYRGLVLGLSITLFIYAWHAGRLYVRTAAHKIFFALWVAYFFRITFETVVYPDRLIFSAYYYWSYAFGICIGSTLAFLQPLSPRVLHMAPWFIWGFALVANLCGLLFRREQMAINERLEVTELLNPISYGQCAVTLILLSAFLALHVKKTRYLALLLASAIPGFFVLAITASRSPLLSLLVGTAAVGYYGAKRGANWRLMLGVVIVAAVLPLGIEYLISNSSAITTRVMEVYEGLQSGGQMDRVVLWSMAVDQFLLSPAIGQGLEIIGLGYPHNITVETLMVMGVVGCALFVWLQILYVRYVRRILQDRDRAWLAIIGLQYLVLSIFSGAFYCSPEFWGLVLLLAGTAHIRVDSQPGLLPLATRNRSKPAPVC